MNGQVPLVGSNGQPHLTPGQIQAMQQQQAHQLRMQLYLNLVPICAAKLIERSDSYASEQNQGIHDQAALEAEKFAFAAMRRLGIECQPMVAGSEE